MVDSAHCNSLQWQRMNNACTEILNQSLAFKNQTLPLHYLKSSKFHTMFLQHHLLQAFSTAFIMWHSYDFLRNITTCMGPWNDSEDFGCHNEEWLSVQLVQSYARNTAMLWFIRSSHMNIILCSHMHSYGYGKESEKIERGNCNTQWKPNDCIYSQHWAVPHVMGQVIIIHPRWSISKWPYTSCTV